MKIGETSGNFDYATIFCDKCDYSCRRKDQIRLHKATKHEGFRFKCTKCDKAYKCKQHLKDHIKAEHEGVRFKCDQCDITIKPGGSLKKHKATHNVTEKKFKCPHCLKGYRFKTYLNTHIKRQHKMETYPCHLCEFEAKSVKFLRNHVINHMNPKIYKKEGGRGEVFQERDFSML